MIPTLVYIHIKSINSGNGQCKEANRSIINKYQIKCPYLCKTSNASSNSLKALMRPSYLTKCNKFMAATVTTKNPIVICNTYRTSCTINQDYYSTLLAVNLYRSYAIMQFINWQLDDFISNSQNERYSSAGLIIRQQWELYSNALA